MIGTRVDAVDAPRLIRSKHGWWFIGNQTWTLLRPEQVGLDGSIGPAARAFLAECGAYRPRRFSTFSLTVLTTTDCNLGCGYCFQNTGLDPLTPSRPFRIGRQRLTSQVIDRIIAFTSERMSLAGVDALQLILFGGEPLLNASGCLALLERTHEIGLKTASMITNGVLLTPDLAKRLNAAGLRDAQVTFDGSREDHDRIRIRRSGAATFDTIVSNIERATEVTDLRWQLRVNVSHHNFERIGELFGQLEHKLAPSRCAITFAWVGDAGFGYTNDLEHVAEVSRAFVDWNILALQSGFRIPKPSMKTTCQVCSVPGGDKGAVVNADGTLFSCWQSAGKQNFEVGTIEAGYMDPAAVPDRWVTCGYEYDQGPPEAVAAFQDSVDSGVLDYLYETGTL